MGYWGVKSDENDDAADALDAGFDRVHGDAYVALTDDRNPLSLEQIQQKLASPETLAAALDWLRAEFGDALDEWDPEARLGFVGVVVRHAECGVPIPDDQRLRGHRLAPSRDDRLGRSHDPRPPPRQGSRLADPTCDELNRHSQADVPRRRAMSDPQLSQPLFDSDDTEPTSLRSSRSQSKKPEIHAGLVALTLIAIAALGYAVQLAYRDQPPAPAPVVAPVAEEPRPAPVVSKRRPASPAPRQAPDAARSPFSAPTLVKEPEPKVPVDPIAGFDTGEAFNNPPSPGQYGRRSSGILPGEANRQPR